ncbi:MAG TPA: solute carrier family 23 protein, partial [Anaeromyxobacteraceae bacterium]
MSVQRTVDVEERLPLLQSIPLSLQHLFAMFGATVLVPYLVGLDTSVTLFSSGVGTLLYIFITKGKIPAYLGSSFAFHSGRSRHHEEHRPGCSRSESSLVH